MGYCLTHNQHYNERHGGFCYQCRDDIKGVSSTTSANSDYAKCKEAYKDGYESGHNDTVESCYGSADEKADKWISDHFT